VCVLRRGMRPVCVAERGMFGLRRVRYDSKKKKTISERTNALEPVQKRLVRLVLWIGNVCAGAKSVTKKI
jgi:hypothetical protein